MLLVEDLTSIHPGDQNRDDNLPPVAYFEILNAVELLLRMGVIKNPWNAVELLLRMGVIKNPWPLYQVRRPVYSAWVWLTHGESNVSRSEKF